MADSPQNPQMGSGKGLYKGKSNPVELLKTPSQSGDTLGNSGNKPKDKIDFLLPPKVPGDIGSLGGFRIIKILGEGGMGLVFLAEDTSLNRKLAIKVILPTHANQTTKERFFREARATAALHHENVIAIFQVGEDNGVPFLAMPFLQGQPLDKYLTEQKKLSVKEALRITMEALAGLSSAHARSMIHRDIKPSNIWLEGARKKVILLDFGLAKGGSAEDVSLTRVGAIMGTPAYMSPEQAQAKEVDRRADLFSMGVVLYEMLTGEGPFKGKTVMAVLANLMSKNPKPPCEVDPGIPQEVSDICMWMLEKDLEKRPKSAREVAVRIQAIEKAKEKSQAVIELPEVPTPAKTLPPTPGKTLQGNPVKTQDGQWQPKNIEEFSKLYPETDAPRPKPSGEMPRKNKKKKSSQLPVFMGLGGVLFFVVGLALFLLRNEPISIEPPKNKTPITVAVNKGPVGLAANPKEVDNNSGSATGQANKGRDVANDKSGFEDLFPDAGHLEKWVNRWPVSGKEKIPNGWRWSMKGIQSSLDDDHLFSIKKYGDFIIQFEIKLSEDADSGIFLQQSNPSIDPLFFELQLSGPRRDGINAPKVQSGSIVGYFPPKNKVVLDREWNEVWIKFEGTHFNAKINGEIVQDFDFASKNEEVGNQAEFIRKIAQRPLKGYLGFQCCRSMGEPIRFRNVQIKELNPTQTPTPPQPYEVAAGSGDAVVNHLGALTGAKVFSQLESFGNDRVKNIYLRAFIQAPKIHFELAEYADPINEANAGGEKGWTPGNYDNALLHMVISRPEFLRKTVFYKNGRPIRNPFTEKQVNDSGKKTESLGAQEPKMRAKLKHPGIFTSLAFSGDGKVLTSGARGEKGTTIKLWDVALSKETATLSDKEISNRGKAVGFATLGTESLVVSQNGKWVAAGGKKTLPSLWDVSNTKPTGLFLHSVKDNLIPHSGEQGLAFNNDNTLLVAAYCDGKIRMWDVATKKEKTLFAAFKGDLKTYSYFTCENFPIAFSPENSHLAASFSYYYNKNKNFGPPDPLDDADSKFVNGHIQLWDVKKGQELRILKAKTSNIFSTNICCLAFSRDGKNLVAYDKYEKLMVWDLSSDNDQPCWETEDRYNRSDDKAKTLAISFDGKVLITASEQGIESVKVWDLNSGKEMYKIRHKFPYFNGIQKIALSPNGKTLAIGQSTEALADSSEITLWDIPVAESTPKD